MFGISPAVGSLIAAVGNALVFGGADFALFGVTAQPAGQPMVSYGRALVSAVVGAGIFGSVVIVGAGIGAGQTRSVAAVIAVFCLGEGKSGTGRFALRGAGLTSQSLAFAALFAAGRAVKDNFPAVGSANAAVGRSLNCGVIAGRAL